MRLTDDLIGDLRYGTRFYRKNPGFASVIVVDGMSVVGAGLLAAYPAAIWMGHLASSRLFGVAPADAGVLAESFSLLLAVTLVAVWLPARRAARIDPIDALRLG